MARYLNMAAAEADGFHIVHEPEAQRFALYARQEPTDRLVGEAHYSLSGQALPGSGPAAPDNSAAGTINFDHTVVHPDFRGTGLSGLLAKHAVTADVVDGRRMLASCWFIEGYLERHPELRAPQA